MFPEGRILDFIIVGAVALIVVGPKDLPILMRKVGQFLAKMRAMAAEFRASFDELARQSELDELRREVEALRSGRPLENVIIGAATGGTSVFDDIHAGLNEAGAPLHEPVAYAAEQGGAAEPPSPASPGLPPEGEDKTPSSGRSSAQPLPPGGEDERVAAAPQAKVETGG